MGGVRRHVLLLQLFGALWGWSGGVGEGRRVSSGRVKSGGPSAVQTKIGAMVTKDTTVRSACDEDTFLFIHLTYLYNRRKRKKFSTVVSGRDRESSRAPLSTDASVFSAQSCTLLPAEALR